MRARPHFAARRAALAASAVALTLSLACVSASSAVLAVDEADALAASAATVALARGADAAPADDADSALQAATGDTSVAPPTETVNEVATWFTADQVAKATGAVVRIAPSGRGLLVDDAAVDIPTVATGVLLSANETAGLTQRLVLTTWRAVNPGFANYSLAFVDGTVAAAKLLRYDLGRPVAVLVVDGVLPPRLAGATLNAALDGLQVGDPTLAVGVRPDVIVQSADPDASPADAWDDYVGYAYDLRAPLPLATGSASPLRNVRCVVARALLTRPPLAASSAFFDASGRLVGLDLEGDLAAAGVSAKRPEVHLLAGPYLADAVADATTLLTAPPDAPQPVLHRGDVGVALTLIPTGAAVQYYRLPNLVAAADAPLDAATEFGGGTAPKVIKLVGVDVDSPAAGLLRTGDIVLAVDGGALLEDDMLAFERGLTAALAAGRATVTVARGGRVLDVAVPVVDLETMHTGRMLTWAGCTFQDPSVIVRRKYQQLASNAVLVTTCAGAADAEAAAVAEAKVAAARSAAFAKPVAGPTGGVGGSLMASGGGSDPAAAAGGAAAATAQAAGAAAVAAAQAAGDVETGDDDDESQTEAATGLTRDGIPAAPSPLLATLMRSRDQQAPVTPTLVTSIGGRPVASLADLIAAARAAPPSTSVAFRGVHSGKGSFSMVDTLELAGSPTGIKQFAYDPATLQWRPVAGGGGGADAAVDAPAAALAPIDAAALPSTAADIVAKPPPKGARKKAAPSGSAPLTPSSAAAAPLTRSSAAAAPLTPSSAAAAPSSADAPPRSVQLKPAGRVDDAALLSFVSTSSSSSSSSSLIQAAVDGPNDAIAADVAAAASSSSAHPSPASVAAWLALAARARGRVPVHATQTWNASQIAAFKRQAVTITIYEWYPLEHNTAASKATGSGFVVDSERGIIATNAHVAGAMVGGWEVLFFDGSTAPARSIWFSPQQDIAFLKVDPAAIPYPDAVAPLASWTTFAADHAVADGDFAPVLAVGSPGAFPFATMQGVYLGESYRATDDIGGLRARNYIKLKTLIQSAGGASGGPVFNAAGAIVGIHFAGGTSDDPRFRNTPYWRESLEVAADYLMDALADGVRDLKWPTRGGLGLEFDLVPIDDAVKFYGLPADAAVELRATVAAANAAAAPKPPHHPRPRDRVILVSGYEPGAPTHDATAKLVAPGDIIFAVGDDVLAGDLLWLERALHARVNATVPLTVYRYGAKRAVDVPVYDLTADRVKRFAVWNGAVLHDVSDRTRYVYRYNGTGVFVAHRDDGSSWPRFRHANRPAKTTTMHAKYVVTELKGVPTPTLADMIAVACSVAGAPDLPTSAVARDLQGDDFPGGQAWEMWLRSGLDPLRVYAWDQGRLGWVLEEGVCG